MASSAPVKVVPGNKALLGPEKVAALLLSMGKPAASRLLQHFDPLELRQITRAAAALGSVSAAALDSLIEDFAGQFTSGVDLQSTATDVEQLLTGVLPPEQVADIMSDVLGSSNNSLWERLSGVPENMIAAYVAKEHPQTAALVLSKLSSSCTAKVMGQLPRELRNELLRRMIGLKPVVESSMRLVETTLHEDLLLALARNSGPDLNTRMADIINKMERDQMEDVLQSLTDSRPKVAETLKSLLFTFDDLTKLTSAARTTLLDQIPTERVVLALKGTDPAFRDIILSSLASRARRIVEHELNTGGPAAQRDVLKARRLIADTALQLAESGQIELNPSDDAGAIIE
jgi:flagellar motor switch protein FliG